EIDELAARVACLPAKYREAVVLRHVQDLSYAEVAETLGQPVGTVKANVHRGLKILRGENHGDRHDWLEETRRREGAGGFCGARAGRGGHHRQLRAVWHGAGSRVRGL